MLLQRCRRYSCRVPLAVLALLTAIQLVRSGEDVPFEQGAPFNAPNGQAIRQDRPAEAVETAGGFERLSDVKEFNPVRADGARIDPEEYGAQFSVIVPARQELCFYQPAKRGSLLNVQFQVESGGAGDINLMVYNPEGNTILREVRSTGNILHDGGHDDGDHEGSVVKVTDPGHFKICLDNKFSTVTNKRVFVDIGPVIDVKYHTQPDKDMAAQDIESMLESLGNIQQELDSVITLQLMQKSKHRMDVDLALDNNSLIVWRSLLTILLIFGSVSLQTYFIRHLFKAPSTKT